MNGDYLWNTAGQRLCSSLRWSFTVNDTQMRLNSVLHENSHILVNLLIDAINRAKKSSSFTGCVSVALPEESGNTAGSLPSPTRHSEWTSLCTVTATSLHSNSCQVKLSDVGKLFFKFLVRLLFTATDFWCLKLIQGDQKCKHNTRCRIHKQEFDEIHLNFCLVTIE